MSAIINIFCAFLLTTHAFEFPSKFVNVLSEAGNVFSIAQDEEHNIWFASSNGFYRYDGYNEIRYSFEDSYQVADAQGNYQKGVYADLNGNIWAVCENIYVLDRRSGSFRKADFIQPASTTDMIDIGGTILLACESGVLSVNRDEFILSETPDGLAGVKALKFFRDGEKLMILTRDHKLIEYNPGDNSSFLLKDLSHIKSRLVDALPSKDGGIWVATDGDGLFRISPSGSETQYKHSRTSNSICSDYIRSICFDKDENLWIATGSGLSVLDVNGSFFSNSRESGHGSSLSRNSLLKIFRDCDSGMWIGNVGSGVDYCYPSVIPFKSIDFKAGSEVIVGPLVEDADGTIWIGTSRYGAFNYNPEEGTAEQYLMDPSSPEQNDVKCIHFSNDGEKIYFGLARNGIACLNRTSRKLSIQSPFPSPLTIRSIVEDAAGHIWLGTSDGLFLYEEQSGEAIKLKNQPSPLYILDMEMTEDGFVQVCSNIMLFSCVLEYDRNEPSVEKLSAIDSKTAIHSITRAEGNGLMACTDSGLYIFDGENNRSLITKGDGLSSNSVRSVLKDGKGALWVGTRNGLSRIDPHSGRIQRISQKDYLPQSSFSEGSALLSRNGTIYFGTSNGLYCFNPDEVGFDKPSHTPRISGISISGNFMPLDSSKKVSIDPGTSFSVIYSVCNYSSFGDNSFYFRLLPSSGTWESAGPGNSITFSNLKHGRYTFELCSENSCGNRSDGVDSTIITVKAFWYQTIAAKISYILILLSILAYAGMKISKAVKTHYAKEIKLVQELSAETILENKARMIAKRYPGPEELSMLSKIISLIETNISNTEFSVEGLAEEMCMSRSNLHRKIKDSTDMSASELIQKIRLEKAAELLSSTDLSVEQVSEQVGYSSSSYFIRAFKSYFKVTPGNLQKH